MTCMSSDFEIPRSSVSKKGKHQQVLTHLQAAHFLSGSGRLCSLKISTEQVQFWHPKTNPSTPKPSHHCSRKRSSSQLNNQLVNTWWIQWVDHVTMFEKPMHLAVHLVLSTCKERPRDSTVGAAPKPAPYRAWPSSLLAAGVHVSNLNQIFTRKFWSKIKISKMYVKSLWGRSVPYFSPSKIASGLIQSEEWFWYFSIWAMATWWRMTPGSFGHVVLFWYHSRHIQLHIYTRALQILYIVHHICRTTDIYFLSFFGNSGLNDAATA